MSKPICLFGRYTKKIRGIKQKQKLCENCEGEGCSLCDYHGISKSDSIEGIICDYLFKKFGAKKAKFTWIGGEDKKSLVLGKGRPFFVKMKEPKRRKIKLTKKKVNFKNPDVTFTINLKNNSTEIMSKPICVFGRYTKKIRGIKQKQKLCENCEGEGCRLCDYHGISKVDSVEGIICDYLFKKFGAKKAKFTWIGGEDKKSLVLGKGRPFFVKIKEPKKRKIKPTKKINLKQIDILDLNIIDQIPKEPIKFRSKIAIKIITEDMITSVILANLKSIKKNHDHSA